MEKIEILIYLLKVVAIQGSFFALYYFLLKDRLAHHQLRIYLLVVLVAAFLIPAITIQLPKETVSIPISSYEAFQAENEDISSEIGVEKSPLMPSSVHARVKLDSTNVIIWIVSAISLVLLARSLFYLIIIQKLKKRSQYVKRLWFKLFKTNQSHPFSFFSNVFIPDRIFGTKAFDQILEHECEHVRRHHSIDRLFMDLMVALLWFNPFMYMYRRALIEVHEYQADEAVLRKYNDLVGYQEILFSELHSSSYSGLVSHFNFSMIKKRIVMMNKQKSKKSSLVYLAIIPVLLLVVFAFSEKETIVQEPETEVSADSTEEAIENSEQQPQPDYTPSIFPLKEKGEGVKLTSSFGKRRDPFDGEMKFHRGIDFRAPVGHIVIATADGVIAETRDNPNGYGKMIIIDHGGIYRTRYAQLSSIDVKEDQEVTKGESIGKTGNSGRSTGPHIHYEVIEVGVGWKDPKNFIKDYPFEQKTTAPHGHSSSFKTPDGEEKPQEMLAMQQQPKSVQWTAMVSDPVAGTDVNVRTRVDPSEDIDVDVTVSPGVDIEVDEEVNSEVEDREITIVIKDRLNKDGEVISSDSPIFVVDGEVVSREELEALDEDTIEEVDVIKGNDAKIKFGDQAADGAVIIKTKDKRKVKNKSKEKNK